VADAAQPMCQSAGLAVAERPAVSSWSPEHAGHSVMEGKPADPLEERRRWLAERLYVASGRGLGPEERAGGDPVGTELRARQAWLDRMGSAFMRTRPVLDRWSDKQWLRFLKEQRDAIDALIAAGGQIGAQGVRSAARAVSRCLESASSSA
jgi:hypothetical protein